MTPPVRNVTVVGAGTMGNGIAHVFAQYGHRVMLCDVKPELVERGMKTIEANLGRQVKKGTLQETQKQETLGRITPSTDLEAASREADLVVEAATEREEIKKTIFRTLDRTAPSQAILASNTSSISITTLGAVTSRPEKVIGMHFMNPVPVMKLVEIVRGLATSDETFKT
ncbi:MAG: 3-hydroxybutyryl-CoA dehydrogenase, partial [Ignavibacteriales bacterium]|nr:3-hydroxybutyryl-CoA dehydrogenase [Ignavibacteriales bacterium]